jgi:hypothetical protein
MATQAQITANRLNALKSKGPVTPEGKQAVRFNALKTGIDATQIIIRGESPEEFEAFAAALRDTWKPADLVESAFVDRLIHNSWRLDRLRIAEAQIWDRAVAEAPPISAKPSSAPRNSSAGSKARSPASSAPSARPPATSNASRQPAPKPQPQLRNKANSPRKATRN